MIRNIFVVEVVDVVVIGNIIVCFVDGVVVVYVVVVDDAMSVGGPVKNCLP